MRIGQGDIYDFEEVIISPNSDPIEVKPPTKTDWGRRAALAAAWGIPALIILMALTTRKKRR